MGAAASTALLLSESKGEDLSQDQLEVRKYENSKKLADAVTFLTEETNQDFDSHFRELDSEQAKTASELV